MYESMMHRKGSKIIFFIPADIFLEIDLDSSLSLVEKVFL